MKCPVCGHKVRPSKKYPGKYLCDTCRKRFPASAVIPDDTDTRSARSSAHIMDLFPEKSARLPDSRLFSTIP